PGLSSTSSTLMRLLPMLLPCEKTGACETETLDVLHYQDQLFQIHRLGDVAVCPELAGLGNLLFGLGRGQYHHRDPSQCFIRFDLLQDLMSALSRQIQVKEDDIRQLAPFALRAAQAGHGKYSVCCHP